MCIGLTFGGARGFAKYLGGSEEVADVTAIMWRTVDWVSLALRSAAHALPIASINDARANKSDVHLLCHLDLSRYHPLGNPSRALPLTIASI